MTAAHQRRPALSLLSGTDESSNGEEGRAQHVIDQWEPEHQYLGALLWLTAEQTRPLLELVPDTAIWRPLTRWALELIRRVVNAGDDPHPVTVLAAAQRHPARDALNPDAAPSGHERQALALYLFDAYSQAVAPASCAPTYAREVLDQAYRRAFDSCGIRMQQLAATGDRQALTEQFTAIRDELSDLWRRADRAAKHLRS